ncbi:hypothetical protein TBR22_A10500 [Luteitalea sp. TBR-22]|uniref:DUF3072 domain-containing protein n=1 Tax=Luteitalea sp. TBR-22 TaxID=2802971 RepID=UPI001AF22D49|nr:DUF3072 domain-containing protein [Luteitalea sp. TBR-22]BCS31847.1 hypothetical protein TBR22_A10500 [Luteitalea sp. TBR-22]
MNDPRDQAGDIHENHEATGGTGVERPSNLLKDPDDWTTGDEPMTDAQRSYLGTLSQEAGEDPPADLTKAEASRRIDQLQQRTGRGAQR